VLRSDVVPKFADRAGTKAYVTGMTAGSKDFNDLMKSRWPIVLSYLDFKMMGVGLATAILIDATIVRAVLLPATMKLPGDWNWYLPRWLPRVGHGEGGDAGMVEVPAEERELVAA
jgi:hypothetical protein